MYVSEVPLKQLFCEQMIFYKEQVVSCLFTWHQRCSLFFDATAVKDLIALLVFDACNNSWFAAHEVSPANTQHKIVRAVVVDCFDWMAETIVCSCSSNKKKCN